jgi:hypothetical protein
MLLRAVTSGLRLRIYPCLQAWGLCCCLALVFEAIGTIVAAERGQGQWAGPMPSLAIKVKAYATPLPLCNMWLHRDLRLEGVAF